MSEDTTYNGWANYPTWACNLWLSNDEGTYNEVLTIAREHIATNGDAGTDGYGRAVLGDKLKSYVEDLGVSVVNRYAGDAATGDPTGMSADIYGWALAMIDWRGIADAWIEQAADIEATA